MEQALGARLIVWPEAAITEPANFIPQYLGQIYSAARLHGSDVIMASCGSTRPIATTTPS